MTVESSPMPAPVEEDALFNAAFISLIIRAAAAEYERQTDGTALSIVLPYVIAPIVLHRPTRLELPSMKTASMSGWTSSHPALLMTLPLHARALLPRVSAGLRLGLEYGALTADGKGVRSGLLRRRGKAMHVTAETEDCMRTAGFLGRWFGRQQDVVTAVAMWGLKP